MCGIAGMFSLHGNIDCHIDLVQQMNHMMIRRGPDDEGLWTDHQACTLGSRRLAIVDTSLSGHQPMVTDDGQFVVVFNGELYDHNKLRAELKSKGVNFRTLCDTEVVLQALAFWGKDALAKFNGMFALAFYEVRKRQLLLARDHAGIKPLYLLRGREGLLFGSQFDQILTHPWGLRRDIDEDGLALYLQLGHIPAPYSLLRDTRMLEPGCWAQIDALGRWTTGRHHRFERYCEPDLQGHEAIDALDGAIASAVHRCAVADVPIGSFLSGGIDSPLVSAYLRDTMGADTPTFTFANSEPTMDESADARRYAEDLGLVYNECRADPIALSGLLSDVIECCSDPLDDPSLFPSLAVSQHARESVKVALSGDGGDDLLWGYPARQSHLIDSVLVESGNLERGRRRDFASGRLRKLLRLVRRNHQAIGQRSLRSQRFIDLNWLQEAFQGLPSWPKKCSLFDFDSTNCDEVAQWLRWNEYSGHQTRVLLKVDRASMFHSLEVRVPLLDKEVVSIAQRINWRTCLDLKSQTGKLPLRELLRRRSGRVTSGKRGFSPPMGNWLRNEFQELLCDQLLTRTEILGYPINKSFIEKAYQRHRYHQQDLSNELWRLLNLVLWEERYFSGRATTAKPL